MNASVLVTDGDQRAALAAVRSLGRAGYRVSVVSSRLPSLAGASRHAREEYLVPDPLLEPSAFAEAIVDVTTRLGHDVVLPITEPSILAALPVRERLSDTVIPFPDLASFRRVCDKSAVFAAAREIGIAVPTEIALTDPEPEARDIADIDFPVVIKPHRSVAGGTKLGVSHAGTRDELPGLLRSLPAAAFPVHVQTRIEGPGIGVFLLPGREGLLLRFAHRRLREKPPSGGVSVYCESTALEPALLEASLDLLKRLVWRGIAMVEFKVDAATGTPYLMEINGRLWGSLQLAVDSGADFPRLLVEQALGFESEPASAYATGRRLRWFWGDVDHLLARLRHSRSDLNLPETAPGRWGAVGGFLLAPLRSRGEVLRLSDPLPAFRETVDWFAQLGGSS